jgi:hypothetical protein
MARNDVRITVKVADQSKDIDKAKDRVEELGDAATKTSGKFRDARGRFTALGDAAKKTEQDVDGLGKETVRVGSKIGQAAVNMVSNFGNVGASIAGAGGPVAAIGLLAVAAAALPAIATAAGAGIALGLGAAFAGIGIAAAAQSEKVQNAFGHVKDHVVTDLKQMAQPFEPVLMSIAARTIETFDKLSPAIGQAFAQIAPLVDDFADSLLGSIGNMGPFIDGIVTNFKPLMNVLSARLPDVIEHVTSGLLAMSGAADPDAFSALISVINGTVDSLSFLVVSLETVASLATDAADALATISPEWGSPETQRQADDLYKQLVGNKGAADQMSGATKGASNSVKDLGNNAQVAADKLKAWHTAVLASYNSQIALEQSIDDANKTIKDNGKTLDINTQKGRENKSALLQIGAAALKAADDAKKSGADTSEAMNRGYRAFIKAARGAGMTRAEARALARQIGLVPSAKTTTFKTNANHVRGQVAALQAAINRVHGKQISIDGYVRVHPVRVNVGGGRTALIGTGRYAHGGIIGAQGGGPRSRQVLVGEQGPELVDLPSGSMVRSNPDTRRMMQQGGAAGGHLVLEFRGGSGSELDRLIWEWIKNNVRVRGGKGPNSVQKALGYI